MITRFYVRCNVCQTHHTLRVQMGYGADQRHRFHCHHCNEPVELILSQGSQPRVAGAEFCEAVDEKFEQTRYQYLSPDFVADGSNARDPLYFGAMDFMDTMLKGIRAEEVSSNTPLEHETEEPWFALSHAPKEWGNLLRCWRLERSGKQDLAAKQLEAYAGSDCTSAWHAALIFSDRLFGCNDAIMREVLSIDKNHRAEFSRLVTVYIYDWLPDLREGQFQVFNEFFSRWEAFSQVYLYVRHALKMPLAPTATSLNFEKVRGFYSIGQEYFAKQIRFLTALNNIKSGRPFDKLQNISLEKYFGTDNAKRRDNFSYNNVFFEVSKEYDSGLRNAEAHNWARLTPSGDTLVYRHGGVGREVNVSYVDYLVKSVALFRQICFVMQVEYLLVEAAKRSARELLEASNSQK